MSTPRKYDQHLSTAVLVRLTPQLHELVKQGAEAEDRGLGDFMRDAAIHRLGSLGLVPVLSDGEIPEEDDE